jgi:hypothetical protein
MLARQNGLKSRRQPTLKLLLGHLWITTCRVQVVANPSCCDHTNIEQSVGLLLLRHRSSIDGELISVQSIVVLEFGCGSGNSTI